MALKNKKQRFFKTRAGRIIGTLLLIFGFTFVICTSVFLIYLTTIDSSLDIEVEAMKLNYSSIVYYIDDDGNEHEFERLYDSQNRTWVNLEDMPSYLQNAAIAIEDHRFKSHHGVDWKRTFAAGANFFLKMKSDFGASTITQQLIKNLTGDNQDSVNRKLQEILRALYLERHYDKDTIIELYLNTIYLGEGCYGVGTASQAYFGKDVSELSLAEAASLVGITNLPTFYNPYINPENNRERRVDILDRMLALHMISKEERNAAAEQEIVFNRSSRENTSANVQSYFVDQIIEDLIEDLMSERGYSRQVAVRTIYSGGLKIYATVNPDVQKAVDDVFISAKTFPSYKSAVQPECAMVVLDPENGNVLAIRGGRGEKTGARVLNRATQTRRPPGSSIKPISVYAPAIEYGIVTPYSVEDDAPFKVLNGAAYPKNETRTYSGRTTIANGVMQSLNTVSMRTLDKLTLERSYNFLTANLGVTSLNRKRDLNLAPLALGQLTNGITVLEMAAAYAPFANGGTFNKPRTYTKVLDSQNNVLLEHRDDPIEAMSKKTATYMSHMLQKVVTNGTGTYARLANGVPAAAKTGTSNNDEDRWFVGFTPSYVGAVWFGYDKPKYISKSLSPALTVWKNVMNKLHDGKPVEKFEENDEFKTVYVCSCSGLLATDACSKDVRGSRVVAGYFHKDDVPTKYCNIHEEVEIDTTTNMLAGEFCPAESRKTVALMKLERFFPISGIVLGDEQYTLKEKSPPEGQHYFSTGTDTPLNVICTLHTGAPETPTEAADGEEQPTDPDAPADEQDGEAPTVEQVDETDGEAQPVDSTATPAPTPETPTPAQQNNE